MEGFITRKRKHDDQRQLREPEPISQSDSEETTEVKLAILTSLHPDVQIDTLLNALLEAEGSVEDASKLLKPNKEFNSPAKKLKADGPSSIGRQTSLSSFHWHSKNKPTASRSMTKKGRTLYLYDPEDIAEHSPCSIIHDFLDSAVADAVLSELLAETPTFRRENFKLFDKVVSSPHTSAFYVNESHDAERQKTDYVYNGRSIPDVRITPPETRAVSEIVQRAVNEEIEKRIRTHYGGSKLPYQSPEPWVPNTVFVNCYDGGKENVGYHSDQLTYLGPRAVIGSLSLGVAREFRVRKIVPRKDDTAPGQKTAQKDDENRADAEGQISIHLPHNSLLVMHAEMQEEWKHSIAPAKAIDPHPLAKNKRINITYRCYRDSLHPSYTPKCRCGVPCVLRCVQRKQENHLRYMWMCHAHYTPGEAGCSYFKWAEFDHNGEPPWKWSSSDKPEYKVGS